MIRDEEVIYRGFREKTVGDFKIFHPLNPHVFRTFKELARQMKATGRTRYSGRNISEKMRWDYNLATAGNDFKLNNNFVAIYVRLLIFRYPKEFVGFFQLRSNRGGYSDADLEADATKREDDDDL